MKDRIYTFWVRKNKYVKYEYEKYVMEHINEHRGKRFKHWFVLLRLTFHYRFLKKKSYIYYPFPKEQSGKAKKTVTSEFLPESMATKRTFAHHIIKRYMSYDVVSFDAFNTLLFLPFNKYSDIFPFIEKKLNISSFVSLRSMAESQARKKALTIRGNSQVLLEEIYEEFENLAGLEKKLGMEAEIDIIKTFCYANPYMKRVTQILASYNHPMVVLMDGFLPKSIMSELLFSCGYDEFTDIIVSCDYNCNKASGQLFGILRRKFSNDSIIYVGGDKLVEEKETRKYDIDYHYYKRPKDSGEIHRPKNMTNLIGSAYSSMVNNHLHCGINRYSIFYEYGYVYGGLFSIGFCNYISVLAKKNSVEKVIFLTNEDNVLARTMRVIDPQVDIGYALWSKYFEMYLLSDGDKGTFIEKVLTFFESNKTLLDTFNDLGLEELIQYFDEYGLNEIECMGEHNKLIVRSLLSDKSEHISVKFQQIEQKIMMYFKVLIGEKREIMLVDLGWTAKYLKILSSKLTNDWKLCDKAHIVLAACNDSYTDSYADIEPYLFSNVNNRTEALAFFNKGAMSRRKALKFLTKSKYSNFRSIDIDGKYEFNENPDTDINTIEELQNGVLDFVIDYWNKFHEYDFMVNISGYDAYYPLKKLFSNPREFKETLKRLK